MRDKTAVRREGVCQSSRRYATATNYYTTTVYVTVRYVRTYSADTFVTLRYAAPAGWWV